MSNNEGQLWGSHTPPVPSFMFLCHEEVTAEASGVRHSKVLKGCLHIPVSVLNRISIKTTFGMKGCSSGKIRGLQILFNNAWIFFFKPPYFQISGAWECVIHFTKIKLIWLNYQDPHECTFGLIGLHNRVPTSLHSLHIPRKPGLFPFPSATEMQLWWLCH